MQKRKIDARPHPTGVDHELPSVKRHEALRLRAKHQSDLNAKS